MNSPSMRRKLTPEDLRRATAKVNSGQGVKKVQGTSIVIPAGSQPSRDGLIDKQRVVLDPALVCPFFGKPLMFLLLGGSVRAFGVGWMSAPVVRAELPQLIEKCKRRTPKGETVPATVYLKYDPFLGEELEPAVAESNRGFEYRGAFWVSQLFRSKENAFHWFSFRGGRAPIFGADVLQTITEHIAAGEDDGEAVRRQDQAEMDAMQEHLEDRTKDPGKTIISQPGLPPGDSRMPGAE